VPPHQKHSYEFGSFRLDPVKRLLFDADKSVPLTPKVFDTLLVLVENRGRVMEKDELMDLLWPDSHVEEANLALNISALRKALGERPSEHRYIVTIPGRGYRFVAPVQEIVTEDVETADLVVDNQERETIRDDVPAYSLGKNSTKRRTMLALGVLLSVIGVVFIFLQIRDRARPKNVTVRSIAVLPFRYVGPKEGDEYLGFGMADAIITRLGNARQITVRPSSAVIRYTTLNVDSATAGRELGVDAVLEGSIRKSGERIKITVQLLSTDDGEPIWGDTFNELYTHFFAIEDSIAARVTQALRLRLTSEDQQKLGRHHTNNPEAYEAYLKGRYFREKVTEEGFRKSIQFFREAIEKEPEYAPAYAEMASCYCLLSGLGFETMPPKLLMPEAKAAAQKALSLDNELAEAHASLGMVRLKFDWDWPAAEREFKEAIQLNPGYLQAHLWQSLFLEAMGRSNEAIAAAQRAREIDPLSLTARVNLGSQFYAARKYDEAIVHLQKALELDQNFWPAHWRLGDCYAQKHMPVEAIAALKKAVDLSDGNPAALVSLGYTYAIAGQRVEAMKVIDELQALSVQRYVSPANVAAVYAGLGETDLAMEWLEKAYEIRSRNVVWLKVWPQYDSLRADPRFADLLKRIGLPE
jgi:DNA-binding winged helix-turn-helix (wHTH) protein/TolB-like protein/Tfp pilus assembly protein PilF